MRISLWLCFLSALPAAELPVREVVLYKHGVAYFERSGEIPAGEGVRLDFKASEMNDVLKSLTVEDRGGKVAGLRYDSSEPLERKLGEFPFRLGDAQPLAAFLDQLKGARLELKLGAETAAGAIVSAHLSPARGDQPERQHVSLLDDSGQLRMIDLSAASSVRFPDQKLQSQFRDYLAALTAARSADKRSLYIDSADTGARTIAASYVIPAPVWKSSYRLIFGGRETTLEGWAIVDNTTGEDWTKVRLALVSGRPISFVSRLYEPRYVARPVAELPEERAQAPVVHEGGVAGGIIAESRVLAKAAAPPPPAPRMAAAPMAAPSMERVEMQSTVAAAAEGRELGELFEYRFAQPVTVRKNESAMLPFLQQPVTARKLLIFSEGPSPHPLNSAEIANNTGKTLDGGPITVFEAGAYGGEALMETLKAGDKRLISYGVDLGTRVTTQFESSRDAVREVRLARGVLTTRAAIQETRTYTIRNVDARAKTLLIEHPNRRDYKLLSPKPSETTANAWRFEVKLDAGAAAKLPVQEERLQETSTAVVNVTPDTLLAYVQNKALRDAARKQLEQIAAEMRRAAETDASIRRTETQISELVQDQARLRENIQSLNRVAGQQEQVQKYARDLAAQESQLAGLRDQLAQRRKTKAEIEKSLNALIQSASF